MCHDLDAPSRSRHPSRLRSWTMVVFLLMLAHSSALLVTHKVRWEPRHRGARSNLCMSEYEARIAAGDSKEHLKRVVIVGESDEDVSDGIALEDEMMAAAAAAAQEAKAEAEGAARAPPPPFQGLDDAPNALLRRAALRPPLPQVVPPHAPTPLMRSPPARSAPVPAPLAPRPTATAPPPRPVASFDLSSFFSGRTKPPPPPPAPKLFALTSLFAPPPPKLPPPPPAPKPFAFMSLFAPPPPKLPPPPPPAP